MISQNIQTEHIKTAIEKELEHRLNIWGLLQGDDSNNVSPGVIRELGIYSGQAGIWTDKKRTGEITSDGTAITVGLLHTGSSYADDISDDFILYHYPKTNRRGHDKSEIEATKAAKKLGLPVFVIEYPFPSSPVRKVHLGSVEDWDDDAGIFLISFGQSAQINTENVEDEETPFEPFAEQKKTKRTVSVRKGQQRFKFEVLKRYGSECAVCQIRFVELLDGAHIIPNNKAGSYDARNGLVLCASHHRAFDAGLFAIEPNTLKIHFPQNVTDKSNIGIEVISLEHLKRKPHVEALEWRWQKWNKK